jgi:hypothetical protein
MLAALNGDRPFKDSSRDSGDDGEGCSGGKGVEKCSAECSPCANDDIDILHGWY